MFRKILFSGIVALFCFNTNIQAQTSPKYGHMNLGNLLEQMPETKTANESLKVFADQLTAKDDSLTKSFQAAYQKLEKDYNDGILTPVQVQTRQAELQKQQEDIQKFEQEAQQKVSAKREELLAPILNKIDEAVKAVAKESGFLMIFDTGSGVMLFAAETEDVTPLVKKKLGIQ